MTAKGEVYVAIGAHFADEEAFALLCQQYGREARSLRDLYVQMLCHCRRMGTDGFVPAHQIRKLVDPDSPKAGERDVKRLVAAGIVERAVNGYQIPAYLKGNQAQARERQVTAAKAEGARRANHERWHRRRDESDPGCEFCQSTDQTTNQRTDQYSDQTTDQHTDEFSDQYSESDTDPTGEPDEAEPFKEPPVFPTGTLTPRPGCPAHPLRRHGNCRGCGTAPSQREDVPEDQQDSPEFTEFWSAYPLKVGKPRARKAWRQAMRKRHDPALIIKAARAYADDPKRKPDYTAHASTWLNDERYNDQAASDGTGPDDDFWRN